MITAGLAQAEIKDTILLGGDSLGVGLCPEFKKLAKEEGYAGVCQSIGGTNTKQWSQWLPSKLSTYHPKLVILSLGTNDSGAIAKAFLDHPENIAKIVDAVNKAEAKLVWIGLPDLHKKKLPYRDQVLQLITNNVENVYDSTGTLGQSQDQIHFTGDGYKNWMNDIWSWIKEKQILEIKGD